MAGPYNAASGDHALAPPRPRFFLDGDDLPDPNRSDNSTFDPFMNPSSSTPDLPNTTPPSSFGPSYSRTSFSNSPRSRPGSEHNLSRPSTGSSSNVDLTATPRMTHARNPTQASSNAYLRDSLAYPPMRSLSFLTEPVPKTTKKRKDPHTKRAKSTALAEGTIIEKPWLGKKHGVDRAAYWMTIAFMFVGIIGGALLCFFGWRNVPRVGNLCLVLEDNFDTLDTNIWQHDIELGGFGNNEFEMTTDSPNNSYVRDGILYIMPTLTSDIIGQDAVFNGHTFNLTGCTSTNLTACSAISNSTTKTVIPPIQSARLTTKNTTNIQYGKVEVRARIPRGDWIWPAIWMLPVTDTYGPWPMSGEIDIMESRGNDLHYPYQGRGFIRSALNWGPISFINGVARTFGWWTQRRVDYSNEFHSYIIEWTEDFLIAYVDSSLHRSLTVKFDQPFFKRGNFPSTVFNGTQPIHLNDPWLGRPNSAPFDQSFYLILNVAVGGTNGWFPDGVGDKPWLDGSFNAMYDFTQKKDDWFSTWPTDETRGMAVDYVKMWKKC